MSLNLVKLDISIKKRRRGIVFGYFCEGFPVLKIIKAADIKVLRLRSPSGGKTPADQCDIFFVDRKFFMLGKRHRRRIKRKGQVKPGSLTGNAPLTGKKKNN